MKFASKVYSSLPVEIQVGFMQTIPGLKHCKMMWAEGAEYDCSILSIES